MVRVSTHLDVVELRSILGPLAHAARVELGEEAAVLACERARALASRDRVVADSVDAAADLLQIHNALADEGGRLDLTELIVLAEEARDLALTLGGHSECTAAKGVLAGLVRVRVGVGVRVRVRVRLRIRVRAIGRPEKSTRLPHRLPRKRPCLPLSRCLGVRVRVSIRVRVRVRVRVGVGSL